MKRTLNKKRLTKTQVRQLISAEGGIHEEYTKEFEDSSNLEKHWDLNISNQLDA